MSIVLNRSFPAVSGPAARRGARVIVRSEMPFDPSVVVGDKLGRWMKTPFDFLAFGARASTGALVSTPERLQTLQTDLERLQELMQDPRPMDEKKEALQKEFEDTLVKFLERGVDVEADVLANIKTMLPMEAANMLSEIIPPPPTKFAEVEEIVDEPGPMESVAEFVMYQREDVAASQIESEVTEINNAVVGLKAALVDVSANIDPAQASILKLKLRESRDLLARRLYEVYPNPGEENTTAVTEAVKEAGILLDEVNSQFFN